MPVVVDLGLVVVAVFALILLYAIGLIVRFIQALVQDWPWPFNHIVGWVLTADTYVLGRLEHLILGALHPIWEFFDNHASGIAAFITGVVEYVLHLNDKANSVHHTAEHAVAAAKAAQKTANKAASVKRVEQILAPTALLAHQTAATLRNYESHVHNVVVPAIDQDIARAEGKAIARSESYTTTAVASLNDVYHRRLQEIIPAGTAIPGYADDTIPIALAGTVAAVIALVSEAEDCWNPMCGDWNLAKDALEAALGGLETAGAIAALVQMVMDPEAAASQLAGAAGEVTTAAKDVWTSLGIPLQP